MPLVQTRGAASAQGFGEFAQAGAVNYIEDVFSCFLYAGTGSSQTITNNIDLSTKGGLTWIKGRSGATGHRLTDTSRGVTKSLASNSTAAEATESTGLTAFGTTGFTIGADADYNTNTATYVSWTFRKQPKFFDVVTYTGNSTARTIPHNLGSVPKVIIIKELNYSGWWWSVYYGIADKYLKLNTTDAADTSTDIWNNTQPTATEFSVGLFNPVNTTGVTYVAYLFASNAGGFGLTGTDNVISCGSFTTDSAWNATVNLGYEPQWILYKSTSYVDNWYTIDNMRGWSVGNGVNYVSPNLSAAEANYSAGGNPTATGFQINTGNPNSTYIYIAIRRGPMKVPTLGTSVFNTVLWTGNSTNNRQITGVGFNPDFVEAGTRSAATTFSRGVVDRLRGTNPFLVTYENGVENANSDLVSFDNDGITVDYISSGIFNNNSNIYGHFFKRAPSFFDEVCYTGINPNGYVNLTINHNLGVPPEIIIIKRRSSAVTNNNWYCGWNMNSSTYMEAILNTSDAGTLYNYPNWFTSAPTASTFEISYQGGNVNQNAATYVAYLFATCAGVSKVGSYTGTGALQTVNCGFTGGARFVLIKRTDSTGNWWTYDSARGISSGNDPYLYLNSTAAEVTNTNYVDTDSTGFKVTAAAPAELNANGGTYIFLAIA